MSNPILSQLILFNQRYKELDDLYCNYAKANGLSDTVFWIIYSVWDSAEPYAQKEICDTWSYSKQTVNSALKNLEKQGLVTLEPVPTNRKNKQIILTEEGKALAKRILIPLLEAERNSFASLTDTERDELLRLLQKHIVAIRAEMNKIL